MSRDPEQVALDALSKVALVHPFEAPFGDDAERNWAYICVAIDHAAIDARRLEMAKKRGAGNMPESLDDNVLRAPESESPETCVLRAEVAGLLEAFLVELGPRDAHILRCLATGRMTTAEYALQERIPEVSARVNLSRAIKSARRKLESLNVREREALLGGLRASWR
jgi:DNA-directed RNA polymerase specialized sigma24 family protein